jgi:hypothetical protein
MAPVEIVNPVGVRGQEDVCRRTGFDLLGQRVAPTVRDDDPAACLACEPVDLFVQCFLEAGGREDGEIGTARRLERQPGKRPCDRNSGDCQSPPEVVCVDSHVRMAIYRGI